MISTQSILATNGLTLVLACCVIMMIDVRGKIAYYGSGSVTTCPVFAISARPCSRTTRRAILILEFAFLVITPSLTFLWFRLDGFALLTAMLYLVVTTTAFILFLVAV